MAEFVMKHLCLEASVSHLFEIASAAVSTEEIGNDIYPPAKRKLLEKEFRFLIMLRVKYRERTMLITITSYVQTVLISADYHI